MSDMELKLRITADGKVAVASVNQVDRSVIDLGKDAQKAGADMAAGMNAATRSTQELGKGVSAVRSHAAELASEMQRSITRMAGSILSVGVAATLARDILNTNRSMEMLRAQLTSLTGSAQAGAIQFKFIQDFATRTPYEIEGLTKTFVTLQGMGLNPTREVMQALTDQASKLGGSQETLTSIALQLGQAYSKGKLQQEDMVILAERGIPIYKLAADALNKTGAEIMDMSAKGEMGRDAIDAIIKKMGELSAGANANAMETLNGKISNLSDAWHQFEDTLLQDKSEGLIKGIVNSMTNSLNILRRNMSSAVDDQIAHLEARIKTYNQSGVIGKTISDYSGYDINLEKNRLDMLKKQKAAEDELAKSEQQRAASRAAVSQTQGWLDELAGIDTENRKEADKKAKADAKAAATKAEHAAQQALNKAKQEALKIEERYQALRDQARTSDQMFIDTVAEYTRAYNTRNISLEQYIMLLAKADDARDKSAQKANPTVQAVPYFTEGGQSLSAYSTADKSINAELDQAAKSAEEYDKWLNQVDSSLSKMGATSADVFDGALGGIHLLTGAFSDLTSQMNAYAEAQAANAEQLAKAQKNPLANAELIAKGMAKEKQLAKDKAAAEIDGAARIAGATATLFEKKTAAYKAFHTLEMGLSAIRMAAQLKETVISVAAGAAKFFSQSGWLGFAGVAAMLAVMAGLGFSKSGTSSVGTATIPTSPDSGTVLGDPNAKSESINNTYQLLKDIHAKEYRELRGINAGVAALKQGITDSITRLFQSGGLQLPPNLNLGTVSNAKTILPTKDPIGQYLLNGLFGTTKREITGNGIYLNAANLAELMNGGQITGQQYTQITTTKKSWFSKKTTVSEIMAALDPQFTDALTKMFRGMGSSMLSMATEFGQDMTTAVNQYVIPGLKINLFGMTSDEMIKTLNNVLSTQLDTMTTQIFGALIAKYQKLGEGMFETATRLVAEKAVVLDAIDLVGSSFKGDAVEMADGLITLAGGIKEFQGLFQDYYSKFYSESEQLANTTRRLIANLGDYGLMLPDTRQAYRDLVNAQQLDTEAGRARYNQLLSLAEAADTYYAANEKLRDSMELLSKDTFATAVDYTRYLRLAQLAGISKADALLPPTPDKVFIPTGLPGQTLPGINAGTTMSSAFTTVAQSNQAVSDEIRLLREQMQAQEIAIAQNTADTAKILKRWEGNGMPETRTTA
ncbi:tape measure protein [Methylomonas sp. 2BW1-5-20]|uniref:tape measure protein n=1 Tax=Methylomonas sp. 2BW1-5-20 TaxID=3376686 RepID=UPI00404CFF50